MPTPNRDAYDPLKCEHPLCPQCDEPGGTEHAFHHLWHAQCLREAETELELVDYFRVRKVVEPGTWLDEAPF